MKREMTQTAKWLAACCGGRAELVRRYAVARRAKGRWCRVLRFHRVIPDEERGSYYRMGVSASLFGTMMRHLAARVRVVSLEECLRALETETVPAEDWVVLTFDDGYLDNRTHAAPVLKSLRLPATFYVSSACLRERMPFWPEVLAELIRRAPAGHLAVSVPGESDLGLELGPPGARGPVCLTLIRRLRTLPAAAIESALAALARETGTTPGAAAAVSPAVMGRDDLRALVADGFSIGSHTVTHPYLPAESREAQLWELRESRRELEEAIGVPVPDFCYPGGGFDETTVTLVREAGYRSAVTTRSAIAGRGCDPYRLPRVGVGEGLAVRPGGGFSGALFEAETSGWMRALLRRGDTRA